MGYEKENMSRETIEKGGGNNKRIVNVDESTYIRPRKKVYGHLLPSISHLRNKLEQKTREVS